MDKYIELEYLFGIKPKRDSPIKERQRWYKLYLESTHWKDTRQRTITDANNRCQSCKQRGKLQVHHLTYKNLGREQPGDLMCLCSRCHKRSHKLGRLIKNISVQDKRILTIRFLQSGKPIGIFKRIIQAERTQQRKDS